MSQFKVVAAIPCYNTAKYIKEVVTKTKKHVDQVIVIDDGSTDNTAEVARSAGALVVNHNINKGYGEAIKSCFEIGRIHRADVLITLDGDGQHNPNHPHPTRTTLSSSRQVTTTMGEDLPHPKIVAGIPAYNEEAFIADIATRTKKYVHEVIVVDDGSLDNTAQIAKEAGVTIVKHGRNKGAGGATRTCFQIARERGGDILITIDGDGQHNPDEIPSLLTPLLAGEADLVIGSRFIQPVIIPAYRKFGIGIITFLFNLGSKVKVSDSQSCFRSHNKKVIDILNIQEEGFGFSVEVLLQVINHGLTIKEVPISCIYHPGSHSLNPLIHGLSVALVVIKLRLKNSLIQLTRRLIRCSL